MNGSSEHQSSGGDFGAFRKDDNRYLTTCEGRVDSPNKDNGGNLAPVAGHKTPEESGNNTLNSDKRKYSTP